jgi:tRNA-2-methylthio-N6-dimethylallyladenosine synthase
MTSHPKDFSDELIAAMRDLPKVCKSVHLPLQAGSTKILADMNRKYTKEEYISLATRLCAAVPRLALTTDIIVGYPGETEEDFLDTLDVVQRVKFAGAFTFIYSKRSGTPAAERTDLVARKIASERFDRLTAELYPIMTEKNREKIGQIFEIMVEDVQW